jgi:hypothetical protein
MFAPSAVGCPPEFQPQRKEVEFACRLADAMILTCILTKVEMT